MIFEDYKEYGSLMNEVAKSIKHHQIKNLKDEEPEPTDKESIGGEVPLDEVLPPSYGHESGARVPITTAKKQPYDGGPWIEGELEDRLTSLLENMVTSSSDQTVNAEKETHHGKVGIVPSVGHGSGRPGDPRKDDPYHKVKENRRKAEQEEEAIEDSREMKKEIENLDLDDEADLPI